jgi:CDGSH-type Zn-finger protein
MRENPRTADYAPGSPVRQKMDAFNLQYSDMLRLLDRAFNGEPAQLHASMRNMRVLKALAIELMQMPSGEGATTAGPAFEYVARPAARAEPLRPTAAAVRATAVSPEAGDVRITIRKDGPYVVTGGVPLTRKSIVRSEKHEPMTWRKDAELGAAPVYKLCRCGMSANKPFCDNSHLLGGFDGTETASVEPSSSRRVRFTREHITITDDRSLCTTAGFCGNHVEHVWDMLDHMEDSRTTFDIVQRVERCPSGRLIHERHGMPIEPDLPKGIAVTKDGPYWVTGGVTIELSDGRTLEVRNRVQLCRCGKSENKPLCDGSHKAAAFKEG